MHTRDNGNGKDRKKGLRFTFDGKGFGVEIDRNGNPVPLTFQQTLALSAARHLPERGDIHTLIARIERLSAVNVIAAATVEDSFRGFWPDNLVDAMTAAALAGPGAERSAAINHVSDHTREMIESLSRLYRTMMELPLSAPLLDPPDYPVANVFCCGTMAELESLTQQIPENAAVGGETIRATHSIGFGLVKLSEGGLIEPDLLLKTAQAYNALSSKIGGRLELSVNEDDNTLTPRTYRNGPPKPPRP